LSCFERIDAQTNLFGAIDQLFGFGKVPHSLDEAAQQFGAVACARREWRSKDLVGIIQPPLGNIDHTTLALLTIGN
jgi:hypothetical protein